MISAPFAVPRHHVCLEPSNRLTSPLFDNSKMKDNPFNKINLQSISNNNTSTVIPKKKKHFEYSLHSNLNGLTLCGCKKINLRKISCLGFLQKKIKNPYKH